MKILYSINYILRDLYVLEYQNKYLMVYRSSGLNPGRKGRILPFGMLADPDRATLSGPQPGYIYKEFFFDKAYREHEKQPGKFGPGISEFLIELEEFLEDKRPPEIDYSHVKTTADIRPIVRQINVSLNKAIENLQPFDWKDLIKD